MCVCVCVYVWRGLSMGQVCVVKCCGSEMVQCWFSCGSRVCLNLAWLVQICVRCVWYSGVVQLCVARFRCGSLLVQVWFSYGSVWFSFDSVG